MHKKVVMFIFIACLLVFAGCAHKQKDLTESEDINKTSNENQHQTGKKDTKDMKVKINQSAAKEAKHEVLNMYGITDAVAVNNRKEIFLSYKVKHMERFHLKKIEKDVTAKLERHFPAYKITVSSDFKLFLETTKLKKRIAKKAMKQANFKKELNELKKLKGEKT